MSKLRKRAAVQSLRGLARDVGLDLLAQSRSSDMTREAFENLQKDVLAKATQEEHTARARRLLQEFEVALT